MVTPCAADGALLPRPVRPNRRVVAGDIRIDITGDLRLMLNDDDEGLEFNLEVGTLRSIQSRECSEGTPMQ